MDDKTLERKRKLLENRIESIKSKIDLLNKNLEELCLERDILDLYNDRYQALVRYCDLTGYYKTDLEKASFIRINRGLSDEELGELSCKCDKVENKIVCTKCKHFRIEQDKVSNVYKCKKENNHYTKTNISFNGIMKDLNKISVEYCEDFDEK